MEMQIADGSLSLPPFRDFTSFPETKPNILAACKALIPTYIYIYMSTYMYIICIYNMYIYIYYTVFVLIRFHGKISHLLG